MLVFELKLIEELLILALEQLADVKHFKLLRLVFTLMAFHWHSTIETADTCILTNTNIEELLVLAASSFLFCY